MPNEYSEENIRKISPREHIRKRPEMYIGGTDEHALHKYVQIALNNAIEEVMGDNCNQIWITLRDGNQIEIRSNGTGLPVKRIEKLDNKSLVELILTESGTPGYKAYNSRYPYGTIEFSDLEPIRITGRLKA